MHHTQGMRDLCAGNKDGNKLKNNNNPNEISQDLSAFECTNNNSVCLQEEDNNDNNKQNSTITRNNDDELLLEDTLKFEADISLHFCKEIRMCLQSMNYY